MSTNSLLQKLKAIDKEIAGLEGKLPWKSRLRRRYLTGRMFWATNIAEWWGAFKVLFGMKVVAWFATEFPMTTQVVKVSAEWVVDYFKAAVEFVHSVT